MGTLRSHRLPNLARRKDCGQDVVAEVNAIIRAELSAARIQVVEAPEHYWEVPYTVLGKIGPWVLTRAWTYWVAEAPKGGGMPQADAEAMNLRWREEVRVAGYAGGMDVVGYGLSHCGTVDNYHIDTLRGLVAFAGWVGLIGLLTAGDRTAYRASPLASASTTTRTWPIIEPD